MFTTVAEKYRRAFNLMTGSKTDEFMSAISENYFEDVYDQMIKKIGHGKIYLFNSGAHPAMMSNQSEFFELSMQFLLG